ncbi:MAG: hypothetical protein WC792_06305 [Candidatus Micrarchaeia archaeon]|jgi:hypothetical protein
MKNMLFLPIFFALFQIAAASHVVVETPQAAEVAEGGFADLGIAGPGQMVEIGIASGTGQNSALKQSEEAVWDQLNIDPSSLPTGWAGHNALIYGSNKTAKIIISPGAEAGVYALKFTAVDEYQGTPALSFTGTVTVSENVLSVDIVGDPVRVSANEEATYRIRLRNKSGAADAFSVTVSGVPEAAKYSQQAYVPANSEATVLVHVNIGEQKVYEPVFTATSLSSKRITASAKTILIVGANLMQELQAAGRGMLLFPSAEQAVIYLLGFIANAMGGQ